MAKYRIAVKQRESAPAGELTKYRQQTVREVRRLCLPGQLDELQKRRYQNPECLSAFLDICDDLVYRDPAAAIAVTREGPAYVGRVFEDGQGGSFRIRAWASLGSAHVVVGLYDEADRFYERASAIIVEDGSGSDGDSDDGDDEHASLACRVARLRCEQQRWTEALAAAEFGVRHFEQRYDADQPERETDRLSLASALVTRANIHALGYLYEQGQLQAAATDLKLALTVCGRGTQRARLSALQSLGYVAAAAWIGGEPAILNPSQVVELMRLVRRSLHRQKNIRHCSVVHAKTRWVMGLALAQESMGLTRRAENYLCGARDDLIELQSYPEAAMISLDLGWWLLQEGQWSKLAAIAGELVTLPWARRFPTEWQVALDLWRQSIRTESVDQNTLIRVYRTIRGIQLRFPDVEPPQHRSAPIGW